MKSFSFLLISLAVSLVQNVDAIPSRSHLAKRGWQDWPDAMFLDGRTSRTATDAEKKKDREAAKKALNGIPAIAQEAARSLQALSTKTATQAEKDM